MYTHKFLLAMSNRPYTFSYDRIFPKCIWLFWINMYHWSILNYLNVYILGENNRIVRPTNEVSERTTHTQHSAHTVQMYRTQLCCINTKIQNAYSSRNELSCKLCYLFTFLLVDKLINEIWLTDRIMYI